MLFSFHCIQFISRIEWWIRFAFFFSVVRLLLLLLLGENMSGTLQIGWKSWCGKHKEQAGAGFKFHILNFETAIKLDITL